jgi:hypothetical protein
MDSGKRIALIVLAVIVAAAALAVILPRLSGTREAKEGEKPWMKAVRKQLQLDEKEYEKGEYLDAASPEEYLEQVDAQVKEMVKDGKLTAQQAEAKMQAVRQNLADKMQAGTEKSWK